MNIYLELTNRFNAGRTRAILSSGQAVVFYRLAIMSKDGGPSMVGMLETGGIRRSRSAGASGT
jgi:hypothetical protein